MLTLIKGEPRLAAVPPEVSIEDRLEVAARKARLLRVITDALVLLHDPAVAPAEREKLREALRWLHDVKLGVVA